MIAARFYTLLTPHSKGINKFAKCVSVNDLAGAKFDELVQILW